MEFIFPFEHFFFLITGPLSSVWKEWVKWCIEFGIDANAIIAVPYDWRLSASMLEERDLYFHKLKYALCFLSMFSSSFVRCYFVFVYTTWKVHLTQHMVDGY